MNLGLLDRWRLWRVKRGLMRHGWEPFHLKLWEWKLLEKYEPDLHANLQSIAQFPEET